MKPLQTKTAGILSAVGAYVFWGILPVYWKLVGEVPAGEILAHRIFWSFIFMTGIVVVMKKNRILLSECRQIMASTQKLLSVTAGALLISLNWFIYIWAVNANRVIDTSLGYYINPLFNVLIGVIVLHERLTFWQMISVLLAAAGVFNMVLHFGAVPWVSIALAVSFGFYGLCKKKAGLTAITSITVETLLVAPFALAYLVYLQLTGGGFSPSFSATSVLLAGAGVVTAIPLLLFSNSATKLSLIVLGLVQYVSPTISLLLGIFLFRESFTQVHLISFAFIWLSLLVFSFSQTPLFLRLENYIDKKRCFDNA